jgi:hypothetical protein
MSSPSPLRVTGFRSDHAHLVLSRRRGGDCRALLGITKRERGDFRVAFDFAGKRMRLGNIESDAISAISHRREN